MRSLIEKALSRDNPARRGMRSDLDLNMDLAGHAVMPTSYKPAAVLVPLVERSGDLTVLLTKRTHQLQTHAGQVAFPGGRVDPEDADDTACALRETHEEIGLAREHIDIAGMLDQHKTGTGYLITPIVGFVTPPFELIAEPGEVEAIFEVPLSVILADGALATESMHYKGHLRHYYAMQYDGYNIWGATAAILVGLKQLVEATQI